MNKDLNLAEILKDCPQGTKLYSTIHGEVEFVEIRKNCITNHPIIYKYKDDDGDYCMDSTTIGGKFVFSSNGECILFPSKDQRDWSKFKIELEMVDGEFYYCFYGDNQKENSFIFIYKKHLLYKTKCYIALSMFHSILFKESLITNNNKNITELRKATEEEKQQLLNAIKIDGYEWDEEKKELVGIEPKFDINTLQPFDKVLVRDVNIGIWEINYFSRYSPDAKDYPFICLTYNYSQCIPYNDETKHLIGTTEMPPKEYI